MTFSEKLLQIDNREEILTFGFSDSTPVWPILRWQLRIAEMQSNATAKRTASREKPVSLLKYIRFCWCKRPKSAGNIDVLSIANFEGNPKVPNRMTVFLQAIPELKKQEWLYSSGRRMFDGLPQTFSFDYFFYSSWLKSKLMLTSPNQQWEKQLDGFLSQISTSLEPFIQPGAWNQIKSELSFINRVIPYYRKTLKIALKKAKPKFILVSEGNNGEWKQAVLFQVAKELNIPTGEVQHGVFNLGMKYGEKLALNPNLKTMKTDYQFVFGPFHARLSNAPVQFVPFGHYDLERASKMATNVNNREASPELKILLVGEGIPPSSVDNGLLRHAFRALKAFKQPFQLIVRLHPSEGPDEKYDPFFTFPGTRYSAYTEESLHGLLQNVDVVISHASTVVFEAIYYKKPVLVLRDTNTDSYIPQGVGTPFTSSDELLELLVDCDNLGIVDVDFWSREGVVPNFMKFWNQHIIK